MKLTKKILSLLLVAAMLLSFLAACGKPEPQPTEPSATEPPATEPVTELATEPAVEEYTEPLLDGYNQMTFYYYSPEGYENCDMWIWFPNQDGKGHVFHECEYGGKVVINVPEGVVK